jgi:pheromone shutdown protein TraB
MVFRKDDIEKLKRSDILDTLVKEFGDTFPEFKRVLIDERDMFLTSSLRTACQPIPNEFVRGGFIFTYIQYKNLLIHKVYT